MFGWRRKNDGFEWHKYVRTTIKLRREDRRAKLNDAKDIAADSLRQAGRAGVAAGSNGAVHAWNGMITAIQWVISGVLTAGRSLSRFARITIAPAGRATIDGIGRRLGALPGISALDRTKQRALAMAAAVAVLLGGGYAVSRHAPTTLAAIGNFRVFAPKIVEGRATVLSGDSLRIDGTPIRLAGIEAPEIDQKCAAGRKTWNCGEAAVSALQKLVRNKTVRCEITGIDGERSVGSCQTVNTGTSQDLSTVLVKDGAVFAEGGLFASFTTLEDGARARKVGLWKGEPERPADYRNRVWETAVQAAPDGCPIKGQISGETKTYVLPWSPSYNRLRIRPARGERWFCSEVEAQAAGWTVASR